MFSFSPTCVAEGYDDYRCTACPEGYEGKYCERLIIFNVVWWLRSQSKVTTTALTIFHKNVLAPCAGVPQVTAAARRHQEAAARNVSAPSGAPSPDHVTRSRASAAAGTGRRGPHVTSAWRGMCVEQMGSSVRLTCHLPFFSMISYFLTADL